VVPTVALDSADRESRCQRARSDTSCISCCRSYIGFTGCVESTDFEKVFRLVKLR